MCSSEKYLLWQCRSKTTDSTRRTDPLKTAAAVIATQTVEQDVYQAESVLKQQGVQGSQSTTQPVCATYNVEWDPLEVDSCTFDQPEFQTD